MDEAGLNWTVDSAGTAGYHIGEAPHHLSQKVAKMNSIDISKQRCRKFTKEDILFYDKIYVMDNSNYVDVKKICGNNWNADKVNLLLNELYPGQDRDVPDPWYGGEDGFHVVFEMLDRACEKIVTEFTR